MITFEKPIGSHADCKELEYVAALHQSGPTIRQDASITADDVINFLTSRHGIKVDKKYVEENLMPGLAGVMDESPDAVFDLAELTSMLIIPHLRKVSSSLEVTEEESVDQDDDENRVKDDDAAISTNTLFESVSQFILRDVNGSPEPAILDRTLMMKIMSKYGESDVSTAVIDEMLLAAGVDPVNIESNNVVYLDAKSLQQATTSDVQQYDPNWEHKATTFYDDVLDGTALDANLEDNDPDEEISKSKFDDAGTKIRRIFTFPTIDFVAENFRSKMFNVALWLLVIVAFFAYALGFQSSIGRQGCAKFSTEFGCRVANSIISWMVIMVQLVLLGVVYVILTTAGNSIYLQHTIPSFIGVVVGIVAIVFSCILSYTYEVQFYLINTFKSPDRDSQFVYVFALILGCFLLLFQIKALIFVIFPRSILKRLPPAGFWLSCEMAKTEQCAKQAGAFKVKKMIDNALSKHTGSIFNSIRDARKKAIQTENNSSFENAMLNFQATADHRERVGGVLYTFRNIWNGTLFKEEGVYIHSRLYAMNFSQWFIVLFLLVLYVNIDLGIKSLFDDLNSPDPPVASPGGFSPSMAPFAYTTFAPQTPYPSWSPPVAATPGEILFEAISDMSVVSEDMFEETWQTIAAQNESVAVDFVASLLNASTPNVAEAIARECSSETISIFVNEGTYRLFSTGFASNGTTNGNNLSRRLQDTTQDDAVYEPQNDTMQDDAVPSDDGLSSSSFLDDILPTQTEIRIAAHVGAVVAILSAISLALVWIPSSVSTIMQFRSGVIGSLYDPAFNDYRVAPDLTTILFGSTFWGTFYCTVTILILVSFVTFLLVWRALRNVMLSILANLIGILVTLVFKTILLVIARKMIFLGFYRGRPMGGNILYLILECWSLGLTVATMLIRLIKLIAISAFYIGRLDTPVFAPGVGYVGPVPLDGHPVQFRKDLLTHDAHRHPYLECLGVLYLLKLRYGDAFGNRAGGQWRLIFVLSLMPWLRRYRLDDGPNYNSVQNDETTEGFNKYEHNLQSLSQLDNHGLEEEELTILQEYINKLKENLGPNEAKSFLQTIISGS